MINGMLMTGEKDAHHGGNALEGLSLGSFPLRPYRCFLFIPDSVSKNEDELCFKIAHNRAGNSG